MNISTSEANCVKQTTNNQDRGICPYCTNATEDISTFESFKHIFVSCKNCGNLTRRDKAAYPFERFLHVVERPKLGRKVASRLFPYCMRRSKAETTCYANYGSYFKWILDPNTKAEGFVQKKREAYFSEVNNIRSWLGKNGVDLKSHSVLDMSGGPGTFTHLLNGEFGKMTVTEYERETVSAMKEFLNGVRVFRADLNDDWVDDEVFSLVLYRACIVFCRDFQKHFEQMKDRIADNGYVYIQSALPSLGNTLRYQYEDYTYNVLYSEDYVRGVLEESGFEVVDSTRTEEYRCFLRYFSTREALPLLWGLWNAVLPGKPRDLSARAFWLLARKKPE